MRYLLLFDIEVYGVLGLEKLLFVRKIVIITLHPLVKSCVLGAQKNRLI